MIEDWLANAYEGMSRRQFLARMSAAGFGLAGFALAADPVEGEVITTPVQGLETAEGKIPSGEFQIPFYEARPAVPGRVPVVLVLPEIFGMHSHIKDVTRRFAREGFLGITFEPTRGKAASCNCPTSNRSGRWWTRFPTPGSWKTWTPWSPTPNGIRQGRGIGSA